MKPISPLPEAIDGRPWTINEGSGSCNTVARILEVPTGPSDADRFVRSHEMAHAKITPRHPANRLATKFGISMDSLQVCEDLRVHRFLRRSGIATTGTLTQSQMDFFGERCHGDMRKIALLLVAGLHTDDYHRAINALESRLTEDELHDVVEKVHLVDQQMNKARLLFRPIGFKQATVPAARLLDAFFPETVDGSEESFESEPVVPLREVARTTGIPKAGKKTKWGVLTVQELPPGQMRRILPVGKQRTFHDEGAVLAAPYRLPVDGRVFSRIKRVIGGTVLVDGSGSMQLKAQDIESILRTAPAATVAVYSGQDKKGTLTILARNGRVATSKGLKAARYGSGNVVDGPALLWLAMQPGPRTWVSDGFVTGEGDRPSLELAIMAQQICKKAKIHRLSKASAVSGHLKAYGTSTK